MGPVEQGLKAGSKSHWMASRLAANGDPSVVDAILAELESSETKVKNAAAKTLSHLASHCPDWFVAHRDFFLLGIESPHNILRWACMDIAGHLALHDPQYLPSRRIIQGFFTSLEDESMVTAAHGIDNLARFGIADPQLHSEILAHLFRVENIPRISDCRTILLGKVADALSSLFPHLSEVNRAATIRFLNRLAMSDLLDGKKAAKALKRIV